MSCLSFMTFVTYNDLFAGLLRVSWVNLTYPFSFKVIGRQLNMNKKYFNGWCVILSQFHSVDLKLLKDNLNSTLSLSFGSSMYEHLVSIFCHLKKKFYHYFQMTQVILKKLT